MPRALMRVAQVDWRIDQRAQASPDFASGVSQTVGQGYPRWVGAPVIRLRREGLMQWRAVASALRGRARVLRVPMVDPAGYHPSEIGGTPGQVADGRPFASGQVFSDGQGWALAGFALAVGAALRGATTLTVDVASCAGRAPRVGQIMSADDWPFVVTGVRAAGGTTYALSVEMPLRADIVDGAPVRLEGVGRFEVVAEDAGGLAYGRDQTTNITVALQEVLAR